MTELLNTLLNLFVMIFVLASMFGLGLSLTLKQVRFRKCGEHPVGYVWLPMAAIHA